MQTKLECDRASKFFLIECCESVFILSREVVQVSVLARKKIFRRDT